MANYRWHEDTILERLGRAQFTMQHHRTEPTLCRCCGDPVRGSAITDGVGIHTFPCISRHWGKHAKGKNVKQCREFKPTLRHLAEGEA